jgi:hypothetical protein
MTSLQLTPEERLQKELDRLRAALMHIARTNGDKDPVNMTDYHARRWGILTDKDREVWDK